MMYTKFCIHFICEKQFLTFSTTNRTRYFLVGFLQNEIPIYFTNKNHKKLIKKNLPKKDLLKWHFEMDIFFILNNTRAPSTRSLCTRHQTSGRGRHQMNVLTNYQLVSAFNQTTLITVY